MKIHYVSGGTKSGRIDMKTLEEYASSLDLEVRCEERGGDSCIVLARGNRVLAREYLGKNARINLDQYAIDNTLHRPYNLFPLVEKIPDFVTREKVRNLVESARKITGFSLSSDPVDELLSWCEHFKDIESKFGSDARIYEILERLKAYVGCHYDTCIEKWSEQVADRLEKCKGAVTRLSRECNGRVTKTAEKKIKIISKAQECVKAGVPVPEALMSKLEKLLHAESWNFSWEGVGDTMEKLKEYNTVSLLFRG